MIKKREKWEDRWISLELRMMVFYCAMINFIFHLASIKWKVAVEVLSRNNLHRLLLAELEIKLLESCLKVYFLQIISQKLFPIWVLSQKETFSSGLYSISMGVTITCLNILFYYVFFLNNRKISEILSSINEVRINLFISNQDILMIGMASTKS